MKKESLEKEIFDYMKEIHASNLEALLLEKSPGWCAWTIKNYPSFGHTGFLFESNAGDYILVKGMLNKSKKLSEKLKYISIQEILATL